MLCADFLVLAAKQLDHVPAGRQRFNRLQRLGQAWQQLYIVFKHHQTGRIAVQQMLASLQVAGVTALLAIYQRLVILLCVELLAVVTRALRLIQILPPDSGQTLA